METETEKYFITEITLSVRPT